MCVYLYEVIYRGCGVCQVCNRPASCTEELRSQKTPSVSAASTSGREDVCGETPTSADNHSGVQERNSAALKHSCLLITYIYIMINKHNEDFPVLLLLQLSPACPRICPQSCPLPYDPRSRPPLAATPPPNCWLSQSER